MIAPRGSRSLQLSVVDSHQELAAHERDWNELLDRAEQPAPMLSYAWISTFFEQRLEPGARWFCVFAHEGEKLVGVYPVIARQRDFGPVSRPILATPYDEHTISVEPLVAAGRGREILPALLGAAGRRLSRWSCLEFERIPESSPLIALLKGRGSSYVHTLTERDRAAFLPIDAADFDAYRASLSRNFRNNLNKARNKLTKAGRVAFEFLGKESASASELPRLVDVEAKSWKGREGSAIQGCEELQRFYRTVCRRLERAGLLEWHFLTLSGETIAGNLCARVGRTVVVWKLGYDQEHRRKSPGTLLLEEFIRRCYERGDTDTINLMTYHGWYDNWNMARRVAFDVHVFARRPSALLFGFAPRRLRQIPEVRRMVARARSALRGAPRVPAES